MSHNFHFQQQQSPRGIRPISSRLLLSSHHFFFFFFPFFFFFFSLPPPLEAFVDCLRNFFIFIFYFVFALRVDFLSSSLGFSFLHSLSNNQHQINKQTPTQKEKNYLLCHSFNLSFRDMNTPINHYDPSQEEVAPNKFNNSFSPFTFTERHPFFR